MPISFWWNTINTFLPQLLAEHINMYFSPNVMHWYASDCDKVKSSKSSLKSGNTIKLICSFQQTLFGLCFQHVVSEKKQLQEGRYTDDFTAERRAEVSACWCYHWTADVFQGAEDCGLNSQSNMLFWKAEKPSAVSYVWEIPEHPELTGCENQRHPLWGIREEPACSPFCPVTLLSLLWTS